MAPVLTSTLNSGQMLVGHGPSQTLFDYIPEILQVKIEFINNATIFFSGEYETFTAIQTLVDYSYIEVSAKVTLLPKFSTEWEGITFVSILPKNFR